MDRLIFTATSAMDEYRLDRMNLTHELANVSTVGFKRAFEVANRPVRAEGDGFDTRFLPRAHTTSVVNMENGPRMLTGKPLDVAMDGKTVMPVRAENGEVAWTRRGDLALDPEGFLRTGEGNIVLDDSLSEIQLPVGYFIYEVTQTGRIMITDPQNLAEGSQEVAAMGIRDTTDIRMSRRPDGLFRPSDNTEDGFDFESGTGVASLTSGSLEGSNSNPVHTLVRFIDHARSFEMQTKMIKEMKENDASGAAMMRLS